MNSNQYSGSISRLSSTSDVISYHIQFEGGEYTYLKILPKETETIPASKDLDNDAQCKIANGSRIKVTLKYGEEETQKHIYLKLVEVKKIEKKEPKQEPEKAQKSESWWEAIIQITKRNKTAEEQDSAEEVKKEEEEEEEEAIFAGEELEETRETIEDCKTGKAGFMYSGHLTPLDEDTNSDGKTLNNVVVKIVKQLLADKSQVKKGYSMTDGKGQHTQNLYWNGTKIFSVGSKKSHCSGATFQTFVLAVNKVAEEMGPKAFGELNPNLFKWAPIKACWYVADPAKQCMGILDAFKTFGLGKGVGGFSKLKPGDFIDYYRRNKTGHSVVFMRYLLKGGKYSTTYSKDVVGFEYFSSNGPTKGLGIAKARCNSKGWRPFHDNGVYCENGTFKAARAFHPSKFKIPGVYKEEGLTLTGVYEVDPEDMKLPDHYRSDKFEDAPLEEN